MRVLLINPFYPLSENPSPPLGLAFLAGVLEQAGIEVRVLDLVVRPYSRALLENILTGFAPDVVAATSVTMSYPEAAKVIRDVKDIAPDMVTLMGGPHVSFRARETLAELPELDFIVRGEGEAALLELMETLSKGRGYDAIPGLAFREDGRIVLNPTRKPGLDLNSLPLPARHLLPLGRYRALGMAISMTTSRGCPHGCIFCVGRKMVGPKVRYRDPVRVVDEMEYVGSLGFKQINLADDLFTANHDHCLAVLDEIMQRRLSLTWTSFARVDTVSPELLHRMKKAGCSAVSFGVETGNPDILKKIRKGITLDQVVAAVGMCTDAGLTPHASFILGLPGETPETLAQTVAFGEHLKSLGVSHGFHLLAPFPGTRVREQAQELGLRILTDDWSQYHANRAIVETESVSREMLDQVVIGWEQEYDKYLGQIKERMDLGLADAEEAWPLVNLERIVLVYDMMMNEAVERLGSWSAPDGPLEDGRALDFLIERIAGENGRGPERVSETLTEAAARGELRPVRSKDAVRWEWVEGL